MLEFGGLPPEINSARMYSGPGSGPLLAAAAAWDALAAELDGFAAGYFSTLSQLQGQTWSGAAASSMAAAATPYITWLTTTAGRAEDTAGRVRATVAAYEAAFTATVPPPVVAANRALMAALVATNFFGQNTPAIAATEAEYGEMWAQDATAMYTYAAAASAAATLTPFNHPPQTTSGSRQSNSTDASEASTLVNNLVAATQHPAAALSTGVTEPDPSTASLASMIITDVAPVVAFDYGLNATIYGFEIPKTLFQGGSYLLAAQRSDAPRSGSSAAPTGQSSALPRAAEPTLADWNRSVRIGHLSVPSGWPAPEPATVSAVDTNEGIQDGPRVLPPWTAQPRLSAGLPAGGHLSAKPRRHQPNAVFRTQDRRYRIPRPTLGG